MIKKRIWVTWEKHRRSTELSKTFNAELICFSELPNFLNVRIFKYLINTTKTIKCFIEKMPRIVFVQNPSIMLAFITVLMKPYFKYFLIIDRHSNFKFEKNRKYLLWRIFDKLSNYTIKRSDLTIVTNEYLENYIKKIGGNGAVLPDKMPNIKKHKFRKLDGKISMVYICTFSSDEPVHEVIEAAKKMGKNYVLYITGNHKKYTHLKKIENNLPENIIFTGYLNEESYQVLISSCDIIIVLTTQEYTINCGAYEALAVDKPMIISNTKTLKEYFDHGVEYTDPNCYSICNAIKKVSENIDSRKKEIIELKKNLNKKWKIKKEKVEDILRSNAIIKKNLRENKMYKKENKNLFYKYMLYYPTVFFKGMDVPRYMKELKKTQYYDKKRLEKIQMYKLRNLIEYSQKYVPFYNEKLKSIQLKEIENTKDLEILPFLTKKSIKSRSNKLLSTKNYIFSSKKSTAGSTGEPFIIYKNTKAMTKELAATWRGYSWANIDIGDRQARFWGIPLKKYDLFKSKCIDYVCHRKRVPAFDFNKNTMKYYTEILTKFKPNYFYGYVSMITEYGKYFRDYNIKPRFDLECIITTAEILSESDRKFLEDTFQAKVFNEYGCGEIGSIAHECKYGSMHIMSENMIVEIIKDDIGCKSGEIGELVITELNNLAMPLIRYKTNDWACLSDKECPCGIKLPVIENLTGRAWDMIVHRNGNKYHPVLFLYIFEEAKTKGMGIGQYKVFQTDYDKFNIKIIAGDRYSKATEKFVEKKIKENFDAKSLVSFELVNKIAREKLENFDKSLV